jgi:hypothetical protein
MKSFRPVTLNGNKTQEVGYGVLRKVEELIEIGQAFHENYMQQVQRTIVVLALRISVHL